LIDPIFLYIAILTLLCLLALVLLINAFIVLMFPCIPVLIFSKRFVMEVYSDGVLEFKKAKTIGGAYITKTGTFFLEKKDVLSLHGKKCVIAHASSDSKVIRPEVQPVLSIMKKLNVDTREKLVAVWSAPLISKEAYEKMLIATGQGDINE